MAAASSSVSHLLSQTDQYALRRYKQWCYNGLIWDFVYWLDSRSYVYCPACWAWADNHGTHVNGKRHKKYGGSNWACRTLHDKVMATVTALRKHGGNSSGVIQFGKMLLQAEHLYIHEDDEYSAMSYLCASTGINRDDFAKGANQKSVNAEWRRPLPPPSPGPARDPGVVNHQPLLPSWPASSGASTPCVWTSEVPPESHKDVSIQNLTNLVEKLQKQVDVLEATNVRLSMQLNAVLERVQSIEKHTFDFSAVGIQQKC